MIKKYKSRLGYQILSQFENDDNLKLKNVTKNLLDILFDIDLECEIEIELDDKEENSSDSSE